MFNEVKMSHESSEKKKTYESQRGHSKNKRQNAEPGFETAKREKDGHRVRSRKQPKGVPPRCGASREANSKPKPTREYKAKSYGSETPRS